MVDYLRSTYNSIKQILVTSIVLLLHIINIIRGICYTKQEWWTLTQLLIQKFHNGRCRDGPGHDNVVAMAANCMFEHHILREK